MLVRHPRKREEELLGCAEGVEVVVAGKTGCLRIAGTAGIDHGTAVAAAAVAVEDSLDVDLGMAAADRSSLAEAVLGNRLAVALLA